MAEGGSILFVGTKKQAQEAIAEQASRVGMPYVNHRWLGGMLTNFQTVFKRLQRMKELESLELTGTAQGYTKKETLQLSREKIKLTKTLGGLRDMQRMPAAVWIVDTKKEHIAVDEARKLGIPVIAVLDTNCDPDEVDFPIPGNDDAIRSAALLTRVVADAVAAGLIARSGKALRGGAPTRSRSRAPSPATSRWPSGSGSCSSAQPRTPAHRAPPSRRRAAAADAAELPAAARRRRPRLTPTQLIATRRERTRPNERERCRTSPPRTSRSSGTSPAAGMMDCKKALEEADGDFDKAVEILRIKGAKDVGKRAGRTAANGLVAHSGNALLELNCETDFVAKNADFIALAQHAGRARRRRPSRPTSTRCSPSTLPDGRTVADDGRGSVRQDRREAGRQPVRRARRRRSRSTCTARARTCRRRSASRSRTPARSDEAAESDARGIAMQIAAMRPKYVTRDEVPADVVATERRIAEETAREEGKPEAALSKIVDGRVNALLQGLRPDRAGLGRGQEEDGQAGADRDRASTVTRFVRFEVGQA